MDLPIPCQRQEAGGRGKKQTWPQRCHSLPNLLPVSNQRLPEILDGWHLLGGSQPEISSPEHTRHTRTARAETEAGTAEGIRHAVPGESALIKLLTAWTARAREGTEFRPNQVCAFVEYPKDGTARNSGPTPYRAAWSLSSVDGESTHTTGGSKPSQAGALEVLPTHTSDICLQCPSLLTARLTKKTWTRDHLHPFVSGRKLDTEETSKQKPNKPREPLQKWQVQ